MPVQNPRWGHSSRYVVFLRLLLYYPNPGAFSGYHRLARTVLLRVACQSPDVEGLDSMVHRSLRLHSAPYVSDLISTTVFRLSTHAHRDPSVGGIGTTIAATKVPYIPDFPKFHIIVAVWLSLVVDLPSEGYSIDPEDVSSAFFLSVAADPLWSPLWTGCA